jgi:glycosyltransferase involved in cell wall biosynthesis
MKIAVYTIAKNEEQFVERWYESAKDADYLLIADTGSSDATVAKAKALGINVIDITVSPWRFDMARNASLAAIPADIDYCIALDMDEVLVAGWREQLEKATATRPRYEYTWSWKEDNTPGLVYGGDKIHKRHGYRWKHPVHEILVNYDIEETQEWLKLNIEHYPDSTKSRSQYLPLLETAVAEDPTGDRNLFYLGREYYFNNRHKEAAQKFYEYIKYASWAPEIMTAKIYLSKCEPELAETHLQEAVSISARRESLLETSKFYYEKQDWAKCGFFALEALKITEKPLDYLCEGWAWGEQPYDFAAISYYNLGEYELAYKYGKKAIEINPNDERLQNNLRFYQEKINGNT